MGAASEIRKFELPAPACWAAAAFAVGTFLAAVIAKNLLFWFAGAIVLGVLAGTFHLKQKNSAANSLFLLLFVSLGALRYAAGVDVRAGRSVANFTGIGRRIFVSGRVCELPELSSNHTRLYLDKIKVGWKQPIDLEGKILLSIARPVSSLSLGDRINFAGFLDSLWQPTNPGALDFARYLRVRGVQGAAYLKDARGVAIESREYSSWRKKWEEVRAGVRQRLRSGLPPEIAGIVLGFVLGDTREIERPTYELFRKTGTLHLLAVSGANVAWVALLPILLLRLFYLSLRTRYLVALVVVWIFVLLTDLQASVLRAAIMFSFWAFSKIFYREASGLQSLGLSAFFLLLVNPLWLFDIGFELSYMATFALIVSFSEEVEKKSWMRRRFDWAILNNLRSSIAVFLVITPLLAYYFNQVTWAALLVNVAAIPLAALITWGSLFSLAISFFSSSVPLAFIQVKLFAALFAVQDFFGTLPHIFMRVAHPSGLESFLLTADGFGLLLVFFRSKQRKSGLYLFLAGLIPLVWVAAFQKKPDFELAVLEARGEMVSVLSVGDLAFVIGGGGLDENTNTPEKVLQPYLAYLGKSKIDGYFPLAFDSSTRTASDKISELFAPAFTGWPVGQTLSQNRQAAATLRFNYLLRRNDSVPFGFRLVVDSLSFLFLPQTRNLAEMNDSLFDRFTVLVAPFDTFGMTMARGSPNLKAVVSTRRVYVLTKAEPARLFFTSKDGTITFRKEKKGLAVSAYLSRRRLTLGW